VLKVVSPVWFVPGPTVSTLHESHKFAFRTQKPLIIRTVGRSNKIHQI